MPNSEAWLLNRFATLSSYGGLQMVGELPNDEVALRLAQEEKPDVGIMQVPQYADRYGIVIAYCAAFSHRQEVPENRLGSHASGSSVSGRSLILTTEAAVSPRSCESLVVS